VTIGVSIPRKEDPALLTGQARFVDDLTLPGMVWMAVVRSPYAHARITGVDVSKALAAPGVVGAFSGQDLADDIPAGLPCAWPVTEEMKSPTHWALARDKARYAGDGVAVVVAESRALARTRRRLVSALRAACSGDGRRRWAR
jgi:carbon-monoxide dehydrogenase large subunit